MVVPIKEVSARSSVEVHDSCNDCCPSACCWPRRIRPHRTNGGHIPPEVQRHSDRIVDQASKVAQQTLNKELEENK